MIATFVHPTQLSEHDTREIVRGCLKIKFQHLEPEHIIRQALSGHMVLYKVRGEDFEGIFIVEPKGDTLWLEMAVGKGLIRHFEELNAWLQGLAKSYGAHSLSALVTSPGIARLWKRVSAIPAATYFTQELKNGR
jgi:hypothetical protein